jgi:hypothetical protein
MWTRTEKILTGLALSMLFMTILMASVTLLLIQHG